MNVIETEKLCKSFRGVAAVDGLSLALGEGEILGFLGTNGAGKTTTIKMLLGLIAPDSGRLAVLGGNPLDPAVRAGVGYMPETAYYYPFLNAYEILSFYGRLCGMDRAAIRARSEELVAKVGLADAGRRLLKTYSKGMLQRVGIAQALLHSPRLLILDEPFTGLDPLARIQFRDLIAEFRAGGGSVIFSSHDLSEAELMCDAVVILKKGRLIYRGRTKDFAGSGEQNLERLFLRKLAEADGKGGAQ